MSEAAGIQGSGSAAPGAGGGGGLAKPSVSGHESPAHGGSGGFVQPSSFLRRPRAVSRPMLPATPKPPDTPVEREQRRALVRTPPPLRAKDMAAALPYANPRAL
jgi:hypothetical protein